MPHHIVHGGAFQAAQYGMVGVKGFQHFGSHGGGAQGFGGHVIDLFQGRFHVHTQNVDLVRIPQDVAQPQGVRVKVFRQAVGTVPAHGGAQRFIAAVVVQIVADVSL